MCCHTHWYLTMYAPIHLFPHAAGHDCSVLTGLCCRHGYEMGAEPVLGAGFIKWVKRKGHRLSTNVSCDTCYVNEHGTVLFAFITGFRLYTSPGLLDSTEFGLAHKVEKLLLLALRQQYCQRCTTV